MILPVGDTLKVDAGLRVELFFCWFFSVYYHEESAAEVWRVGPSGSPSDR